MFGFKSPTVPVTTAQIMTTIHDEALRYHFQTNEFMHSLFIFALILKQENVKRKWFIFPKTLTAYDMQ
jgi:hypothetical protein